jgi:hypothetical protein
MSDPTPTTVAPKKPAEDKKPAPPSAPAAPRAPADIPVALVEWDRQIHLPGKQLETSQKLVPMKHANGNTLTIDYVVALRHFRVTYTDKQRPQSSGVRMVPVERALSWEPAA